MAASLTTLAWLPQILKIIRKKSAGDISTLTNTILALACFLWLSYGIAENMWPVILANSVGLFLILTILALKFYFSSK